MSAVASQVSEAASVKRAKPASGVGPAKQGFREQIRNLRERLGAGVKDGSLTTAEGKMLAGQINSLEQALWKNGSNGLTPADRKELAGLIATTSRGIHGLRHNVSIDSDQASQHLKGLVANREKSIEGGVKAGKLTLEEATTLRAELDKVRDRIGQMAKNGFDAAELREGMSLLAKTGENSRDLRTNVVIDSKQTADFLNGRIQNMKDRIAAGVEDGSLTKEEAKQLTKQLDDAKAQIDQLAAGGFTAETRDQAVKLLDATSQSIFGARHDEAIDPVHARGILEGRLDNIRQRIASGQGDGSLTEAEATDLVAKAKELETTIAKFGGDGFSPDEIKKAQGMLDELRSDVAKARHDPEIDPATGAKHLMGAGAKGRERIAEAVKAGTLSPSEAELVGSLLDQIDGILGKGGPETLTATALKDAMALLRQFDRFMLDLTRG